MWDLTTALELKLTNNADLSSQQQPHQYHQQHRDLTMVGLGGPTPSEFAKLLDRIELASTTSGYSTPTTNNCFSPCGCGGNPSGFIGNNGNGAASTGGGKYKNLLVNSAASLTAPSNTGPALNAQHAGSIIHHHNQLIDDDKSKSASNE